MRRLALVLGFSCFAAVPLADAAGTGQGPAPGQIKQAKPWIGILIETRFAGAKGGVAVKDVIPGTPADRAGLKKGDEVLAIDGIDVKKSQDLMDRVAEKGVGQQVTLRVARAGKEVSVILALEAKPDELNMLRNALVGKPAPPFAIPGADSSKLKGQVVLVEFWATWCAPCRQSAPRLEGWHKKYASKGLRVVGISDEKPETIKAFTAKHPYAYPVGSDPKAREAYFAPVIPMFIVIDKKGIVQHVEIGGGSKLEAVEQAFLPLLAGK